MELQKLLLSPTDGASCARIQRIRESASAFESEGPQAVCALVKEMVGHAERLPITAFRRDWLHLECKALHLLNVLVWTAMCRTGDFSAFPEAWITSSEDLCRLAGCEDELGKALNYSTPEGLADSLVTITIGLFEWAEKTYDCYEANWQEWELKRTYEDRTPSESPEKIERKREVLRKLQEAVEKMPGFVGLLLSGSWSNEWKGDSFSDLDVFTVFDRLPDDAAREDLNRRLGVDHSYRMGNFQALNTGGVDFHILDFERNRIDEGLSRFESTGEQDATMDFSSAESLLRYTPTAHRWVNGRILSDPQGVLKSFKNRSRAYPTQMTKRLVNRWTQTYVQKSARFSLAQEQGDRIGCLTALNGCIEAPARVLLAKLKIHTEEADSKWLCLDLARLEQPDVREAAAMLPADLSVPVEERFESATRLWGFVDGV